MIIPPALKHYYELTAGKYIRYGQNHLGESFLSIEEVTRAAFLKKDRDGGKVWMYQYKGYMGEPPRTGWISSLMEYAQCYPYSDELYQFFQQLTKGDQIVAYKFLHPQEEVDEARIRELRERWEHEKEIDAMLFDMSDYYTSNS